MPDQQPPAVTGNTPRSESHHDTAAEVRHYVIAAFAAIGVLDTAIHVVGWIGGLL